MICPCVTGPDRTGRTLVELHMNRSLTFISAVLLNGVLSHSQTFKNSIEDANGRAIANTADGGFVLAGINWTHSVTGDMYLVRTNANGEVQWSRTFGGSERDYCAAVEETNDGGSMMVGSTESFGALGRDVYVVKTNTTGNVLWSRTYGCLLYTSDAADERSSVDLGGRRIIKKKTKNRKKK